MSVNTSASSPNKNFTLFVCSAGVSLHWLPFMAAAMLSFKVFIVECNVLAASLTGWSVLFGSDESEAVRFKELEVALVMQLLRSLRSKGFV